MISYYLLFQILSKDLPKKAKLEVIMLKQFLTKSLFYHFAVQIISQIMILFVCFYISNNILEHSFINNILIFNDNILGIFKTKLRILITSFLESIDRHYRLNHRTF